MYDDLDFWEIIEENQDKDLQSIVQDLINSNQSLKKHIDRLTQIKNSFEQNKLLLKTSIGKSSKLSAILSKKDSGYILDVSKINDDGIKNKITEDIFEAYHLTSIVLQELRIIDEVSYTINFIDKDGNYRRVGNVDLQLSDVRLEQASKERGGNYKLRLNESALKARLLQKEMDQTEQIINRHFQKFSEPFRKYEASNNTGWRINRGVLSEAFERHWENLKHRVDQPQGFRDTKNDLGSIGQRWLLYKLSSGSDPYFTGPDTIFAQVKNSNASLIDNLNTVINTMEVIFQLVNNANDIKNYQEALKKVFKPNTPKQQKIAKDVWDLMNEQEQKKYQEEVSKVLNATNITQSLRTLKNGSVIITFKPEKPKKT